MNTLINVVRYHLVERFNYIALAWGALALSFIINLIIFAVTPGAEEHRTGGLLTIYVFCFISGLLTMTRSLPFGITLGASRRSYYLGTVLLAVTLAAVDALILAGLQVIERATGGWGVRMDFFRVPVILDGPWYVTWLTSFIGLSLMFVYGIWYGLVFRRWNLTGVIAFSAAQTIGLFLAALVLTWTHAWHSVGHFLVALSNVGLTGILALLAAGLLVGGASTMRRVTV